METLWRQALKTFSGCQNNTYKLCPKNFEKLKYLMNNMTCNDVKVDKTILDIVEKQDAPMSVINIYENNDITIAIFLLKHGVTLPMHDHPGMHGLLKVICGSVKIDTYTIQVEPDEKINYHEGVMAVKHPPIIADKNSSACVLSPDERNFHEIHCTNGPAAFLDILSPPYDIDYEEFDKSIRPCTFFRQSSQDNHSINETNVKLIAFELPSKFYSTNLQYLGPPLR
ncbi:hypothetical protein HCN44_002796 [Aphidius gifuensis]|uniref:2-aminoethanethiol dioxygenase n=1 Tax=Aphidius gifuensis TaxID=684658 RepID=A0A835CQ07_APHGI|nr:2-aminoethanethiol dioxygenase [Aphidius gifuensis]KAF7991234.1 hypothetical protein HCN44_002796 [Aphidius gifuensis]